MGGGWGGGGKILSAERHKELSPPILRGLSGLSLNTYCILCTVQMEQR
jgi:hypothetical protein